MNRKMTQEEKALLLKDLCARLPYGVKINVNGEEDTLLELGVDTGWVNASYDIDDVKPYLRPMSSMTEEEKEELSHLLPKDWSVDIDKFNNFYFDMCSSIFIEIDILLHIIDWLNKHHFDYRRLIEKGLALEAPEEMYNIN